MGAFLASGRREPGSLPASGRAVFWEPFRPPAGGLRPVFRSEGSGGRWFDAYASFRPTTGGGPKPSHVRMSGFVLDLGTLQPVFDRVEVESPAADLGLPQPEWREAVRGSFVAERSGERVSVRGNVHTRAHLECARCLTEFDLPLAAPIVVYAERSGSTTRHEQDELERDDHMLFHDGRRLDLRGSVRESLLLELP